MLKSACMALCLGTLRGVLLLRYIHLLAAIHTTSGGVTPICDQADQSATMLFRLCYRNTDDLEPPSVTGARVPGLLGACVLVPKHTFWSQDSLGSAPFWRAGARPCARSGRSAELVPDWRFSLDAALSSSVWNCGTLDDLYSRNAYFLRAK